MASKLHRRIVSGTKKPRPWRRVIVVLGILMFCVILSLTITAVRNGFDWSGKPLVKHNHLFAADQQANLQHPMVFKSRIQRPMSNYNLPAGFHLTVYEVNLKQDRSLSEILRLNDKRPDWHNDVHSSFSDKRFLKLIKAAYKVDSVSNINLRYRDAHSVIKTIIRNDTLVCYYLNYQKFSISYDYNAANYIWGSSEDADYASIALAFIKRKRTVYVVMLFKPNDRRQDFASDMLFNMIKK